MFQKTFRMKVKATCTTVVGYQHFGEPCCLYLHLKFLQNLGILTVMYCIMGVMEQYAQLTKELKLQYL
jgi:hypothetical protein